MKKVAIKLLKDARLLYNLRNGNVIDSRVTKLTTFLESLNTTKVEALYNVKIEVSKYAGNPPNPSTVIDSAKLGGTSGTYKKTADGKDNEKTKGNYIVWAVLR